MRWWHALFGRADDPFSRVERTALEREANLRERHERLERLAIEVDVITRTDASEESHPQVES